MKKNYTKYFLILIIVALVIAFFYFDLKNYLSLDYIKEQRENFNIYYNENTIQTIAIYLIIYILATALSLPGAAILTLLGGAIFGVVNGTIIVSFASTIGATLAFLVSRFFFKDFIQKKFSEKLATINEGIKKEGAFYLFTLRLMPVFPFFIINLLMGLTPIKTVTYFFVSQLGMLAGTVVYVYAGTRLSEIDSLKGILSPELIFAFILIGIFPLLIKKLMPILKRKFI